MKVTSRIPRWFLVCVLLIMCISVATLLLNHSTVQALILRHLESQVGMEMSGIHIHLIPNISIEVFDLLVRDEGSVEPILRAPQASLSLRLWPLLTRQMRMLELHAVEPEVVIRRDRGGVWHVPFLDEKQTAAPGNTADHKWVMTAFHVTDGSLLILDEDRLAAGGVRIHHVQAAFESNRAQTQAEVELVGKTEDGGDLRVNGSLALAKTGGSGTTNILPARFEGTFRFQHFDLAYWLERTSHSVTPPTSEIVWRGNISSAIHLDFLSSTQGFNVALSDLNTDLDWMLMCGDVLIQSAGTNHPAYAISLSTSPLSSDTFFKYVPASWIPKSMRDAVREHDLKGTVEFESVALRGQINVFHEPDEWHMIAKLSNGSGVWGEQRTRIHNLSATIALNPQHADITALAGEVNNVQITRSTLTVSDLALQPTLDMHLFGTGKIEHVHAVLQQFGGGTEASPFFHSITDPSGTLQMAIHLAGPVLPKPSLRVMKAEVRVQDLGVRLAEHLSVAQLKGSITADSRLLRVHNLQGMVQGIQFDAEGSVNIESGARVTNIAMHLSSDGRVIRQLLATKFTLPPGARFEGPAYATLSLSGTAGAAHCRGMVDLSGTELVIPSVLHKKKGVPGRLEFEAKIIDGKRVMVDDFKLVVRDSQLVAGGQINLGATPKFHVQMKTGPVSLRELAEMGVTIPITDGILEASAMISGEGMNWKLWAPTGWVNVRNGVVTLPGLDKLTEVSGRLQLTKRGALLDDLSFNIGESDVQLTAMIEHWRDHPRATVIVESSHLDVTKVVPKTTSHPPTTSGFEEWFTSKEATITFLFKQLQFERLVLRTVSGEIKVDPRKATLKALRGETPKGVLFGEVEARLGPRQRMDIDANLQVDGIPAQDLLSTRETTEPLQGNVSLNGVMEARVEPDIPIQNTLSTTRRGITIKVTNGRLQQDPVLTKVLKILNIPAALVSQVDLDHDGIPFRSLSGRVIARNGVLSSEDIVFDSPIIKVTGAGTADIKENGLNLALAVSPMAAYSDLIDKIPLFGPLLGGDHSGISTALFEAKGSLGDPEVSYLPLESFGQGLIGYPRLAIDVLVNSIKLPKTAFANAMQ